MHVAKSGVVLEAVNLDPSSSVGAQRTSADMDPDEPLEEPPDEEPPLAAF
jgi:hypothetical protein